MVFSFKDLFSLNINIVAVGLYCCMSVLTLFQKSKWTIGQRAILIYTLVMVVVGAASFVTTLKSLEAAVVEVAARTAVASDRIVKGVLSGTSTGRYIGCILHASSLGWERRRGSAAQCQS
jgi:hypothetical protein